MVDVICCGSSLEERENRPYVLDKVRESNARLKSRAF